jgi:ABC-2 type transport system ATP-binding protein
MTLERLDDHRVRIETPGELSTLLHWLANADLDDVYIQPVGLRSVYDRFHFDLGDAGGVASPE